jgi:hypothetical protein
MSVRDSLQLPLYDPEVGMKTTHSRPPIDLELAQLDPGSVFETPSDVIQCGALSRQQKIAILHRWQYDAAESAVALEEGMPGREDDLQRQLLLALEELHAQTDAEHVGPTKQHGLPD